jgi:hypothetical protein
MLFEKGYDWFGYMGKFLKDGVGLIICQLVKILLDLFVVSLEEDFPQFANYLSIQTLS